MIQKVLKVGTSAAVTIPKAALKKLGLTVGDKVKVAIDEKKRVVKIEPAIGKVDKELLTWTEKFIEKYRPALEELAK